jgi:hypothetical protein
MGLAVLTNYYKYREGASGKDNLYFSNQRRVTRGDSRLERIIKALLQWKFEMSHGGSIFRPGGTGPLGGVGILPSIRIPFYDSCVASACHSRDGPYSLRLYFPAPAHERTFPQAISSKAAPSSLHYPEFARSCAEGHSKDGFLETAGDC